MATDGSKLTQLPELTTLSDDTMLYAVDDGEDYHVNFETIKDETVPEVFTPTTDGLVPHPNSGNGGKVLRGDGTWQGTFDSSNDGLVPKLGTNDKDNVLRGDGAWVANDKLIGTGSGSLVTFDAIEAPMPKLKASIVAKQDLHGYDKPWVGGAGKNKLPMTVDGIKAVNTSGTWSGNAYTVNGVTFTIMTDADGNVVEIKVNGTANANAVLTLKTSFALSANSYIVNGCPAGGSGTEYRIQIYDSTTTTRYNDEGSGSNMELSNADTLIPMIVIYSGYNAQNLVFKPMIRLATETDATFAPYSNICPISGWDAVKVSDVGKNLVEDKISGMNISSGGIISSQSNYDVQIAKVVQGVTYTFTTDDTAKVCAFYSSKPISGSTSYNSLRQTGNSTVTAPITGYIAFRTNADYAYAQCEVGETDTSYEPYNPDSYTIAISLPQTVYGGEVDVVNGTSGNSLTHGFRQGFTRGALDSSGKLYKLSPILDDVAMWTDTSRASTKIMSNMFEVMSLRDARTATTPSISQHETSFYVGGYVGDEATLDALLSNLQVKYELATPTTLTTQPTPIKSLNGLNNLSVDSGEVIELEYQRSITEAINTLENSGGGSITEVIMGGLDRVYGTTTSNYIGTFNSWVDIDSGKSFSDYDEILLVMKPQSPASYGEKVYTSSVKGTLLQHYDKYAIYAFPEGGSTAYVKCGLDYTNNKFYLENFNYICPIALVGVKY